MLSAIRVVSMLHDMSENHGTDQAFRLPNTTFGRLFNCIHEQGHAIQILDWIALELTHEYYETSVEFIVRHVGYILAEGEFSNYNLGTAMHRFRAAAIAA